MNEVHSLLVGISSYGFMLALSCLSASAEQSSTGMASFYSAVPALSERLTAAHRYLPFGTMVRVTRIDTGKTVIVRINDRGPFVKGRIIDLSRGAAQQLEMIDAGQTRVRIDVVEDGASQKVAKETVVGGPGG